MPSGIILSSASPGATQEAIEKVLSGHGLEVDKPEPKVDEQVPEEPKRDAFESEEEFEAAHVEWQDKQEPPKEDDEEEEEGSEKPAVKKPSKFQKRISKITSRLEKENKELRDRLAAVEGKKETKEAKEENPRPVRDNFASQEQYEDALLAWGTAKALADRATKEEKQSEQEQTEQNFKEYGERVELFKEEHSDWDEVVNQKIPMHAGVQLAIIEQENGPEVTYYLGTHPVYAKKLAEMTPLSAIMEVGRLSTKLLKPASGSSRTDASRGATDKPKPRVPAPVRPVSTAATSSTLTSRDAAKSGNFRAFKSAQRAGR